MAPREGPHQTAAAPYQSSYQPALYQAATSSFPAYRLPPPVGVVSEPLRRPRPQSLPLKEELLQEEAGPRSPAPSPGPEPEESKRRS
ncbi:unnamed protein product [Boreogadus saida]